MIRKLRKKVVWVLMSVVCLFLVGILGTLFFTAKGDFERRSLMAFRAPAKENPGSSEPAGPGMPFATGHVDASGAITIERNQIYYVTDAELVAIIQSLQQSAQDNGQTETYSLRYRRHPTADGTLYFFSDTYMERNALNAQVWYSVIIGVGAIGLFFVVSVLLSRWMIRPVERAWEKQRQFVADASHELRTPLTVVLSNADMLLQSGAVTDEKNRIRLDNIRAEGQRMKGLVEDLLALARSDNKPSLAVREPVNFSYLVSSAALMLEPVVFDRKRPLRCDVTEGLCLLGDPARLRQLADILLDNALKYGDPETPIGVTLAPGSRKDRRDMLLRVQSQGAPLSPEQCRRVFERFIRLDASRAQVAGYGLGLSIAQSIVQEHGGRIWAESDGVKTNTFAVRLPCTGCETAAGKPPA